MSCAKIPTKEIDETKTAFEIATKLGAEAYASDEFKKLQAEMDSVLAEIKSQDKKLFRNYNNVKKTLKNIKENIDALILIIPDRKKNLESLFVATIAELYIESLKSALMCSVRSEYWHMATESELTPKS